MGIQYFPYSEHICHHVYGGGCTFCAFHFMEKCVSKIPVPVEEQIRHFDRFVSDEKNKCDIFKKGKILVESNGSFFVEIPKQLRFHIYNFVEKNGLELHTQCRATLINKEKTQKAFEKMLRAKYGLDVPDGESKKMAEEAYNTLNTELKPYMLIFTGLEVADDGDLRLIHKGCCLDDFIAFSAFVRSRGARVGANVLIGPPLVNDPIKKAVYTAQFAFNDLKVHEVAFCCCIPRLGAPSYDLWKKGKWNPTSATECSEIFRVTKAKYPEKVTSLYMFRVHCFHGRYTKPNIKTDGQKMRARRAVRKIAREVFSV